jgi:hypothetical protein
MPDFCPVLPDQMAGLETFDLEGAKIALFLPGNVSTIHSQFRIAEENSSHATSAA